MKPVRRPEAIRYNKQNDFQTSEGKSFNPRNAVVAIEEQRSKAVKVDELEEARKQEHPFNYNEMKNCDLERQSIMINLLLQDGMSLKSKHLNVLIEHRPMKLKNFDLQGKAPIELSILEKQIGDRQHFPDVYTNIKESLYNGLEYV